MAAWTLGDEYRQERILELEAIADEVRALPGAGLEIPYDGGGTQYTMVRRDDVLDLIDDRVNWLQDRSDQ